MAETSTQRYITRTELDAIDEIRLPIHGAALGACKWGLHAFTYAAFRYNPAFSAAIFKPPSQQASGTPRRNASSRYVAS